MSGRYLKTLAVLVFLISVAGCVTVPEKPDESQTQALENRISALEASVLKKDSEIISLTNVLEKEKQEKAELLKALNEQQKKLEDLTEAFREQKKEARAKTYYKSVMKVQTALRNAGFDPGTIDGQIGPRTQEALKEFQKAHGLTADGRLDKQTWDLLRQYLEPKK